MVLARGAPDGQRCIERGVEEKRMQSRGLIGVLALSGLILAGCETPRTEAPLQPAPAPEIPASIRPGEIVGNWGLAAYHRPDDRARTESAARGQCSKPYRITEGPSGGVMMHLADQSQAEELRLKGGPGGKNYVGPRGEAGLPQDREILSFDGRVMVTRYVDPEVHGRYGFSVYVRCGARA
jgi:hypothetical protein